MTAKHFATLPPLPQDAKVIPSFPTYCLTPDGIVYTCRIPGSKIGRIGSSWKPMKLKMVKWGKHNRKYFSVTLRRDFKPYSERLHCLLLETFIGPRPHKTSCGRHLDDNSLNNSLENLAWGTKLDNYNDSVINNLASHSEDHYISKLTNAQIRQIRRMRSEGKKPREIAPLFGVRPSYIGKICTRQIWKNV